MKSFRVIWLTVLMFFVLTLVRTAAAQSHSVDLTWTQGTCTGCTITGNNVYRGTASGGPYTLIKASSTAITAYSDVGLPAVTTYYYVVTAVCSSCNPQESPYSNEAKATTLADKPLPASGLTATPH
jgi:hypothetical protein